MNFISDKDQLLKGIALADSVVSHKNINDVTGQCYFSVSNGYLEIIGTDKDMSIKHKIEVLSKESFSFLSNGKKFIQILKEIPKGEIIIDVNDSTNISLKPKAGNIKGLFSIAGTKSDEFPEIKGIDEDNGIVIDQQIFKDMIRKVIYAASIDSSKIVFNGLLMVSEAEGYISLVASDSRRLSITSAKFDSKVNVKDGVIIPLKTINELQKILSSGSFSFLIKGNQIFFKVGNTEIISRLVDGNFPNYKQVMPKDYLIKCPISKMKILESVRRVMVFSKEPSYRIICSFNKNILNIESKLSEIGEACEEIEIQSVNEKMTIGINAQYILDSLNEVTHDNVVIGLTGTMSPVTVISENDENTIAVIMPIQIKAAENE